MAKKAQATVTISAQNKLKAGIQDATKELGNFGKVVDHLGKLTIGAGIGLALKKIGDSARYCIDEFAKIEPVQRKLKAALKQGSRSYEEAQETIAKYSKQTLQAGDDVTALVAKIASLGKSAEEIDDLTHACVALSNVTGNDLNSSLGNLLDSLNGEVGELKKFVPELANMSKEALKTGDGIQLVIDKFGNLSEEISKDSFAQTQKNIEDSWSTTSQSIGQILKNDLQGVVDWWAKKSEEIANTFSAMAEHSENQKILSGIKNNYITPEKSHDEYLRGHVVDQKAAVKDGIIEAFEGVPTDVLTAELARIASEYARDNRGADYEYSAEDKLWTETIKKVLWQRNANASKRDEPTSTYGAVEIGGNVVDDIQVEKSSKLAQIKAAKAAKKASEELTKSAQDLIGLYGRYLAPRTDEEKIDALVEQKNTLDSKLQELIDNNKGDSEEAASIRRIIDGIDLEIDDLNKSIVDKLQAQLDADVTARKEEELKAIQAAEKLKKEADDRAKELEGIWDKYNPEEAEIRNKKAGYTEELQKIANKLTELERVGKQNTEEYKKWQDLQAKVEQDRKDYNNSVDPNYVNPETVFQDSRKKFELFWRGLFTDDKAKKDDKGNLTYNDQGQALVEDSGWWKEHWDNLWTDVADKFSFLYKADPWIELWDMIWDRNEAIVQQWQSVNSEESIHGSLQDKLETDALNLAQAFQPLMAFLKDPIFASMVEIFHGFAESLAPVANEVVRPLMEALHQLGAAFASIIGPIVELLKPAFILIGDIIIRVAAVFQWVGDHIHWAIQSFLNWMSGLNLFGWKPFKGLAKENPEPEHNIVKYIDNKVEEYHDKMKNPEYGGSSTQTAVQNASYTGSTNITLNIYQNGNICGDNGIQEFAIMIKDALATNAYYGD